VVEPFSNECHRREQSTGGVTRRSAVRLLPYLFLLYIIGFLDRVNVSYAGLEIVRDLGFSDRVFGLGLGILWERSVSS
jgi:hypothetical protein